VETKTSKTSSRLTNKLKISEKGKAVTEGMGATK
jgi:hypothetical protein